MTKPDETEEYRIFVIGGEEDEQAVFTLFHNGHVCRLRCTYRGKAIEATTSDFFKSLCDIRLQLAKENLIPFCYGASLNVYPLGMARDMGRGLKAYKLTLDQPAKLTDLVETFSDGFDVIPASVEAQREFFENWLVSSKS